MSTKNKANELARIAKQKGHIEAVRRLQLALELELRDAGVKGLNIELAQINSVIGHYEVSIGAQYDDALFELEGM